MIDLQQIRAHVDTANAVVYIRSVFVSLGVDPANIKAVHHAPHGFAPRPNRWCVVFHRAAGLSAVQINARPGLSGAIVSGNIVYVLLGDMERVG